MKDVLVVPVKIAGCKHYLVTAKGLEALGLHDLAAEQREAARQRTEVRLADQRIAALYRDEPLEGGNG